MKTRKFYTKFKSEQDCIDFLKIKLEKNNLKCSKCGCKKLKWNAKYSHWRCNCMKKISIKSVTFFKDSNLSLLVWFEAIFLITDSKKTISIKELSRKLGIKRYATVQYLTLKIYKQMSLINSLLQFDETFNFEQNEIISNANISNIQWAILKQKPGKDLIRLTVNNVLPVLSSQINSRVPKLNNFYLNRNQSNKRIKTMQQKWRNTTKFNLLKILNGIHHNVSIRYLQYYLDEYSFKYNTRNHIHKFDYFMHFIPI